MTHVVWQIIHNAVALWFDFFLLILFELNGILKMQWILCVIIIADEIFQGGSQIWRNNNVLLLCTKKYERSSIWAKNKNTKSKIWKTKLFIFDFCVYHLRVTLGLCFGEQSRLRACDYKARLWVHDCPLLVESKPYSSTTRPGVYC